jgi:hypothetical protein
MDQEQKPISPFMRFLARTVRSVRAAGLPRYPAQEGKIPRAGKDGAKAPERDWEVFARDLGRAVRKFKDGGPPEK